MDSTGSSASSTNSSSSRRALIALRPPKPHGERGLRPQSLQLCQPAVEGREPIRVASSINSSVDLIGIGLRGDIDTGGT
jgi:hypothetical protein